MNIVDGKKIATDISIETLKKVNSLTAAPHLTVVACNPNFETQKYLTLKKTKAETLGIKISVIILPNESDTASVVSEIKKATKNSSGIVVQLPLPDHIDTRTVLLAVPTSHDVDVFRYQDDKNTILPPVIGAIDEISKKYGLKWSGKKVVVFGEGRLVGLPAVEYAKKMGAAVTVITKATQNVVEVTKEADIIVLGVGKPNLLTANMVKDGVAVFDAGASEDGGLLVGDASLEVASKALLFTPVPGGIGPVTIAILFRNLLELHYRQ